MKNLRGNFIRATVGPAVALFLTLALTFADTASAQTTLGELMPANESGRICINSEVEVLPAGRAGPAYTVPSNGIITSWSTRTVAGTGQELTLKVYRPAGGAAFTVLAHDGPRLLTPESVNTFATDIPVRAGDVIGLDDDDATSAPNSCSFPTSSLEDSTFQELGNFADGVTFEPTPLGAGTRVNVTATFLGAPTITAITPADGPAEGGTAITISGTEFATVQSVTVGTTSMPYAVTSETSITTAVPPGTEGGSVPVVVTTALGSASSSFTYATASSPRSSPAPSSALSPTCTVPSVKRMKLRVARETVRSAHCALGKNIREKGANNRNAKVVAQTLKPGTVGPVESVVRVTLGKS